MAGDAGGGAGDSGTAGGGGFFSGLGKSVGEGLGKGIANAFSGAVSASKGSGASLGLDTVGADRNFGAGGMAPGIGGFNAWSGQGALGAFAGATPADVAPGGRYASDATNAAMQGTQGPEQKAGVDARVQGYVPNTKAAKQAMDKRATAMAPTVKNMTAYITTAARARGIDPNVALTVARREGLQQGTWQSNVTKNGVREPSYGPFQMLSGGKGTGFPEGLGNAFQRDTGLDPKDPANWQASVDYALDHAVQNGWGDWYGAKAAGITGKMGIGPDAAPKGVSKSSANANSAAVQDSKTMQFDPTTLIGLTPIGKIAALAQLGASLFGGGNQQGNEPGPGAGQ